MVDFFLHPVQNSYYAVKSLPSLLHSLWPSALLGFVLRRYHDGISTYLQSRSERSWLTISGPLLINLIATFSPDSSDSAKTTTPCAPLLSSLICIIAALAQHRLPSRLQSPLSSRDFRQVDRTYSNINNLHLRWESWILQSQSTLRQG